MPPSPFLVYQSFTFSGCQDDQYGEWGWGGPHADLTLGFLWGDGGISEPVDHFLVSSFLHAFGYVNCFYVENAVIL